MDIKEITGRNYYATKRRNLITNETSILDFLIKIEEEKEELCDSWIKQKSTSFDHKELADIVLVCFTMAQHFKIDLLMEMENKMLFNETSDDASALPTPDVSGCVLRSILNEDVKALS